MEVFKIKTVNCPLCSGRLMDVEFSKTADTKPKTDKNYRTWGACCEVKCGKCKTVIGVKIK